MNTEVESGTVEPTVPVEGAPAAQPVAETQPKSDNGAVVVPAAGEPQSWEELGVRPETCTVSLRATSCVLLSPDGSDCFTCSIVSNEASTSVISLGMIWSSLAL